MQKKILAIIFLMLICSSMTSHSTVLARTIEAERSNNRSWNLTGQVDYWDETGDTPNPCYKIYKCMFTFLFLYFDTNNTWWVGQSGKSIIADNLLTMKDVKKAMGLQLPYKYTDYDAFQSHLIEDPKKVCFTLVFDDELSTGRGMHIAPGATCFPPPPEKLKCNIIGNTTINHGTLLIDQLAGAKSTITLNLNCNIAGTVTVFAVGNGTPDIQLNDNGTLASRLYINGINGREGVEIDIKEDISTPINITSELLQTGEIEAGPFHGSGLISFTFD